MTVPRVEIETAAYAYRRAIETGERKRLVAVMDALGFDATQRQTAWRRVKEARRLGLLEDTVSIHEQLPVTPCDVCGVPFSAGYAVLRIDGRGDPLREKVQCCSAICLRQAPAALSA